MSDALDELRKKYFTEVPADQADPDAPKVFHIFTRAPFEASEGNKPEEVAPDAVDKAALSMAQGVVEDFEAGLLKGIALVSWNEADGIFETHVSLPLGLKSADGAARMLGALEILRGALHDIASSGTCIMSATGSMTDQELEALNGGDEDEPEDDE